MCGIQTWPAVGTFIIMTPRGLSSNSAGTVNHGTTTEIGGIYVGPNFLIRYPMAISDAYPNGRWHPYVGFGVGAHQMAMKPGGARGVESFRRHHRPTGYDDRVSGRGRNQGASLQIRGGVCGGEVSLCPSQRAVVGSVRAVCPDRRTIWLVTPDLVVNPYSSTIDTVLVHAGLSMHFDWKP